MDLLRLYFDSQKHMISFEVSFWVIIPIVLFIGWTLLRRNSLKKYRLVELNIPLGGIGRAIFKPNIKDLQIAHQIWTELVTRKAAIPIDPDHDLILEVYDSWYTLFSKVRELIANIPADLVRKEKSTKEIVRIATATLNDGLRPHLTKWQARFRNWYMTNNEQLKNKTPQDFQKEYPDFDELIDDMLSINSQMIAYAAELKKLLEG